MDTLQHFSFPSAKIDVLIFRDRILLIINEDSNNYTIWGVHFYNRDEILKEGKVTKYVAFSGIERIVKKHD